MTENGCKFKNAPLRVRGRRGKILHQGEGLRKEHGHNGETVRLSYPKGHKSILGNMYEFKMH